MIDWWLIVKILIAESNAVGRNLLNRMRELDGHQVVVGETRQEAVRQFSAHQPDIVFLSADLLLSHHDDFVEELK